METTRKTSNLIDVLHLQLNAFVTQGVLTNSIIFHSYMEMSSLPIYEGFKFWPILAIGTHRTVKSNVTCIYMMTKRHSHLLPSVLAVELSLPVFTIQVCRDGGSNPHLPLLRQTLHLSVNSNDKHIYIEWKNYIFRIATKSQYCTTMNSLNFATATT